jgi:hypothetical protein
LLIGCWLELQFGDLAVAQVGGGHWGAGADCRDRGADDAAVGYH